MVFLIKGNWKIKLSGGVPQGLVNYGSRDKSGSLAVFINKVLLKDSWPFIYMLSTLFSSYKGRVE